MPYVPYVRHVRNRATAQLRNSGPDQPIDGEMGTAQETPITKDPRPGGYRLPVTQRGRASALVVVFGLLLQGCTSTVDSLAKQAANRAFIEAVNLQCRSTKAKIEIAGKIARIASQTDKGTSVSADAQSRLNSARDKAQTLIDRFAAIAGPNGLKGELSSGFKKLQDVSNDVADGRLTKEEGLRQIEAARAQLRANGFDDCA